jgi:hypothetical protein
MREIRTSGLTREEATCVPPLLYRRYDLYQCWLLRFRWNIGEKSIIKNQKAK